MPIGDLITQKEAAAILNRSISAVSRAIKDGRLEYADPKNRLLHRPGLEMLFARKTRPRIDVPQCKSANSLHTQYVQNQPKEIAMDYWSRLDQKLSLSMGAGPAYWQEPSNPQRLRLFVRTIDELWMQCELEGLEP